MRKTLFLIIVSVLFFIHPACANPEEAVRKFLKFENSEKFKETAKSQGFDIQDFNDDGKPEIVLVWTLLGPTYWRNNLSIIAEQGEKIYTLGLNGEAKFSSVKDEIIYVDQVMYAKDDPICCPTLKRQRKYYLADNQIFEMNYSANIEDPILRPLPKRIEKIVYAQGISHDIADCKLVGMPLTLLGAKARPAYFVTVESKCLGNAAGRIKIVDLSKEPSVIMNAAAYSVEPGKEQNNGLNDLKIFMGNAGHAIIEYWIFDGNKFIQDGVRSWSFSADCSKDSTHAENPFDCSNKQ